MKVSLDCFVCSFQCVHLVCPSLKVCGIIFSLKIKFQSPAIVLISLLPGNKENSLFHLLLFFLVYLFIVLFWCISFQWLNFYLRFGLFQSNNEKKKTKELWIVFCNFFPLFLSLNKELLHWQNPTAVFLRFFRESEYESSRIWQWGRGVQTWSLHLKQYIWCTRETIASNYWEYTVNLMHFRKDDS